ncbi:hypothetical protein PR048_005855 [Dryococelus australis]|uniref:Uncharacterized protein n=1 Tax=Dryococelus australis TaxID=614101 RepID=A0ABQ9I9C9_9NEOP|nr:hypothetical protein PR048_005855 [Dryococelus australis]
MPARQGSYKCKAHSIFVSHGWTLVFTVVQNFGTVVPLVNKNYDCKCAVANDVCLPGQWHFKFNPTKRFYLKRSKKGHDIKVKGEVHYRSDFGKYKRIC